ncbi:MAG: hypothetical protein R3D62_16435 [Xanthobacteraceae bacterium]
MTFGISFSPLVPEYVLWAAMAAAIIVALLMFAARSRGAWPRTLALALIIAALANPSLTREDREPLSSVAVLLVDKSASQDFGERGAQTEAARAELTERLQRIPGLELRTIEAANSDGDTDGTQLFSALSSALADVPPDRVAGAILLTDGRVHDVPADASALGFAAPLHALVTGYPGERDRRVVLVSAPRFGIVGQEQSVSFRVEDVGGPRGPVEIRINKDGEFFERRLARSGETVEIEVPIEHAGQNIIEIEAAPLEGELTPLNNRAVVPIDGVRDKLRVLLVSGEPHAGERTWRNLLKSDANVDLVHFTILRPPEKQDGTPINELSLIAFPTRELFQQKIDEFQLIIFDRYARQGVLPLIYFDNIARYVRNGGAVLIAAGPDYASPTSLWRTPLEPILPAEPNGQVTEAAFRPELSTLGRRHPVTRGLEGADANPPHWSHWFRLVDTTSVNGMTVMQGPAEKPALVLARYGEGRVALLLSDHIWLWARGFEGGGPHIDLLRRLSHWLMKQPDLEEEALRLSARGRDLVVQRQTMGESVNPVTLTAPSGATQDVTLDASEPGVWRKSVPVREHGVWRATDGKLTALVNVGPANPREFADVTSATDVLAPMAEATGGVSRRLAGAAGSAVDLPRVVAVRSSDTFAGDGWIGLKMRQASVVRGVGVLPMFAGLLGIILLVGSLAATWAREGR